MRRLLVAAGIVLALAGGARAEFVAKAKDFKCLKAGATVAGKRFVIFHRNPKKLQRAVRIAESGLPHRKYPVGTIIQIFPFEAMAKRGGSFNPSGGGWEFFNLRATAEGTRITGRTQDEKDGKPLHNLFGACQDRRCHGAPVVKRHDFVCEGLLPWFELTDEQFEAFRQDPRCP